MNRPAVLTATLLIGLIASTTIYSRLSGVTPTVDPEDVALRFIRGAPTFSFDGIGTTLRVVDSDLAGNPAKHLVTLSFVCLHSGYGDRTGKPTLQVLTPHRAAVTVIQGKVTGAVLDDRWDELKQAFIQS